MTAAEKHLIHQELQTAENYSNITSEKIKNTMNRLKAEGHVFGRAPYGYKNILINGIRTRVEDEQEQSNIAQICEYYDTLGEICGYKSTLNWCNEENLTYRHGKPYTLQQIKKIINN